MLAVYLLYNLWKSFFKQIDGCIKTAVNYSDNNLHKELFKQVDGIINVAGNVSDIWFE